MNEYTCYGEVHEKNTERRCMKERSKGKPIECTVQESFSRKSKGAF